MEKEKMLRDYMEGVKRDLIGSVGISLPDSVINSILIKYKDTDLSYKDLISEVNGEVENFLDEVVQKDEEDVSLEKEAREEEEKKIEEMAKEEEKVEKRDVTINDSDINLMMIASASTPQELQDVINKIPNLNVNLKDGNLDNLEFNYVKNMVFEQYRDSIPEALRDIGNLELVNMDEYKNLAENINNDYDSITIDNGDGEVRNYDIDKDLDVEKYKNDNDLVNNNDIDIEDTKEYVEKVDTTKHEKEVFDINKDNLRKEKKQGELEAMMPTKEEAKENSFEKENTHKVLKLNQPNQVNQNNSFGSSNSEKGYTDTLNVMLSIISFTTVVALLLLYFIIN